MHLCDIPQDKIPQVEIPTGLPLVYDWEGKRFRLLEEDCWSEGEVAHSSPLDKYNFGSAPELIFKLNRKHLTPPSSNEKVVSSSKSELYDDWEQIVIKCRDK